MKEHDEYASTPAELHRIKSELLDLWVQLPPDHQATMSLVLINKIMDEDVKEWVKGAITIHTNASETTAKNTATPAAIPISWISREDLAHNRPELSETIAALAQDQIEYIAKEVGDALQETYWLAIGIILDDYLGGKDGPESGSECT